MSSLIPVRTSGTFLSGYIDDYVREKRALGCRYNSEVYALGLLDRFMLVNNIRALKQIDTEVVNQFLNSRPRTAKSFNVLQSTVLGFLDHLASHRVLSHKVTHVQKRVVKDVRRPYIFTADQVKEIMQVARTLPTKGSNRLRGQACYTIFALLYTVGMRVGEVCRLQVEDIDVGRRTLLIRETKFYKTRLVPLGPRLHDTLVSYLESKKRLNGGLLPAEAPLFSFQKGLPVSRQAIGNTFRLVIKKLDIQEPLPGSTRPRLHDLRHSFAVGRLLRWYRQGIDVSSRLYALSTFLGHVDPNSTQVYLTITEELLVEAGKRFERFAAIPDCALQGDQS